MSDLDRRYERFCNGSYLRVTTEVEPTGITHCIECGTAVHTISSRDHPPRYAPHDRTLNRGTA